MPCTTTASVILPYRTASPLPWAFSLSLSLWHHLILARSLSLSPPSTFFLSLLSFPFLSFFSHLFSTLLSQSHSLISLSSFSLSFPLFYLLSFLPTTAARPPHPPVDPVSAMGSGASQSLFAILHANFLLYTTISSIV